MHKRLRVSFTKYAEILKEHLAVCSATLHHMENCSNCTDDGYCPAGAELYEKFKAVKARARLVTDVEIDHT
jgi:hypothetical protein